MEQNSDEISLISCWQLRWDLETFVKMSTTPVWNLIKGTLQSETQFLNGGHIFTNKQSEFFFFNYRQKTLSKDPLKPWKQKEGNKKFLEREK